MGDNKAAQASGIHNSEVVIPEKAQYANVTDKELPGTTVLEFLDKGLEEVEPNVFRLNDAPTKAEVMSATKKRDDTHRVSVQLTANGARITQPIKVQVQMPEQPAMKCGRESIS